MAHRHALAERTPQHDDARAIAPEADALGALVLAGIEGGLLLSRAERSQRPLILVGEQLAQILESRM